MVCYLVPGPTPCPEVVTVFYIRPAKVPTLSSVEGEGQVEQQNTIVGFLTSHVGGLVVFTGSHLSPLTKSPSITYNPACSERYTHIETYGQMDINILA